MIKSFHQKRTLVTHILSLSLSLSQKLPTQITSLLSPFFTSRSTTQILSSPANSQTNLRRPKSFLHRPIHEPNSTTQILSSPADPRPISLLHRPIHEPNSTSTDLSLCWFVCMGLFVCECVSVLICLCECFCVHLRKRRWGAKVVVHGEKREKLVQMKINKIINTCYSNHVYLHGYCSSWKYTHIFTPTFSYTHLYTHWCGCFFCWKCVKLVPFSILEDFTWADGDALKLLTWQIFQRGYYNIYRLTLSL